MASPSAGDPHQRSSLIAAARGGPGHGWIWHPRAILYNDRPHVFYYDDTNGNLRHGYWNGAAWSFETLDGAGGPNGRIVADMGFYNEAFLYNGRPHNFYYDATNGNLRHAYFG